MCSTGSSTIDYFISSLELAEKVVELKVAERWGFIAFAYRDTDR